jgi:hypothetical protein
MSSTPLWWPIIIEVTGLLALASLITDLRTGQDVSRSGVVDRRENPGGFWFLIAIKAAFVCFAIAEVLFGIGLINHDPWVWLQQHTSVRPPNS